MLSKTHHLCRDLHRTISILSKRSIASCKVTASYVDSKSSDFELNTPQVKNWSNNIDETRALKTFSEEVKRFRVPVMNRDQEELDLVTTKNNSVHVLTQSPFGVHTFTSMARQDKNPSEHSFVNLHTLMPFGEPVPWLGCLPNNDLILFSPEMGCFLRLKENEKYSVGSVHYLDEESSKQRGRMHQYGFSYFGSQRGKSGDGKTSNEWGISGELLMSHGRVLIWQKGKRNMTMFQFATEKDSSSTSLGLDVKEEEEEEESSLKVEFVLPDGILNEGEGVENISCPSRDVWTVTTNFGRQIVLRLGDTLRDPVTVHNIVQNVDDKDDKDKEQKEKEYNVLEGAVPAFNGKYTMTKNEPFTPPSHLSFDVDARYGAHPKATYYSTIIGQPRNVGSSMSVYASMRNSILTSDHNDSTTTNNNKNSTMKVIDMNEFGASDSTDYGSRFTTSSIRMKTNDLLANVVHRETIEYDQEPVGEVQQNNTKNQDLRILVPILEFVDTNDDVVRTIEATLPNDAFVGSSTVSLAESQRTMEQRKSPPVVAIDEIVSSGELITLQSGGWVRLWDANETRLREDLDVWKDMHGQPSTFDRGSLEITGTHSNQRRKPGEERTTAPDLEMPKHGKENDGKQHVGGNTWAGGTGGSNTAGLGGRGGPYRLDGGHEVHQVSDALKDEVSEEAKMKAREMAEEAFQQRLQDIELGTAENDAYENYFVRVEQQVSQLQSVLENVRARSKERTWLRHETHGELDDAKIVDGAAGERNVYKRRGSENPSSGTPQRKPKQLRFVFDVSGSMYRFNGQDQRLDRLLETAVMVMEAMDGMSSRFQYSIVGHSGDGPNTPFVELGHPPKDRGEQLRILQRMVAHTQFCMSGDSTLEAAEYAIQEVSQMDGDEAFVFVVSDANLRRYGISPHELGSILTSDPDVNACAIFIASLADEAARIEAALPAGTGHICFDTSDLPQLFRNLFAASFAEDL